MPDTGSFVVASTSPASELQNDPALKENTAYPLAGKEPRHGDGTLHFRQQQVQGQLGQSWQTYSIELMSEKKLLQGLVDEERQLLASKRGLPMNARIVDTFPCNSSNVGSL